ncbi:MAG: protein kinase [Deltaproteobacteria bacterium]|nr:protein kinase [Deltaproteobacteria bacterium]
MVFERLGVGGMATVHRAKERGIEDFERIVALKRLLPHLAEDASFVKSFVREAKLASMLQHANIVQLYELGRVGTTYFISMEYIDGRDIRRILRQARKVTGPPTINVTLSLLIQLCDALDYAHTRHDEDGQPLALVHRDVSPSNLLVTKSGHLKVIDFGIAKAQSSQLRTATGRVKGKLAYMAPEAISGKELDARSDIFSAGVIAHELLTARPLFASKNEYQTLIKVQRGDVLSPSTFNQACPPELDAIVLKALARDPEQRYRHASEMRDDLHGVRIKYNLSATNREVSSWSEWAFSLEAPGNNFSGPMVTDSLAGMSISRSPINIPQPMGGTGSGRNSLPLRAPDQSSGSMPAVTVAGQPAHDDADAEVAWGGQEQDSNQPVVLDDVPDVSSKFPAVPRGVAPATAMAMGMDTASRKTMVGAAPPPGMMQQTRRQSQPNLWAQGSSEDAIPVRGRPQTSQEFSQPVPVVAVSDDTTRTPLLEASSLGTSFGAGIIGPKKSNAARNAIAAVAVLAAIGGGVFLAVGRGSSKTEAPAPVAAKTGTLKIVMEPADSTIRIAGMEPHTGSPYSVDFDPGQIQVQITHAGFKSYVTTIDLSAGETQTIRALLEQGSATHSSTLSVESNPPGLVAILDGNELPGKTPLKMEVGAGPHTVVLKQNGAEVWRQEFLAEADATYDYKPILTEEKKREREAAAAAARVAQNTPGNTNTNPSPRPAQPREPSKIAIGSGSAPASDPSSVGAPVDIAPVPTPDIKPLPPTPGSGSAPGSAATTGSGSAVTGSGSAAPLVPTPTPPTAQDPIKVTPPPTAPGKASPVFVKNAALVKRVTGSLPAITTVPRAGETPPSKISTMLCIDAAGSVTTVKVMSKGLPGTVPQDLQSTMSGWKYAPYRENGVAVPACFVVSFGVKWPENSRGN